MIELPAECNVLTGHVIKGPRNIPRLKRVPGVLREIWGSRRRCCAIDGRQQYQIASGIVNLPAPQSQAIEVFVEPEAVVEHIPQETLLPISSMIAKATHSSSGFASRITGQRECHPIEEPFRPVVVLHLNAVVGMQACAIRISQGIGADSIVVRNN